MASDSIPSVIVLRERQTTGDGDMPPRALSIETGSFEATAISRGIEHAAGGRPLTHDLFVETMSRLGVKLERIEINAMDAPVFYSRLVLVNVDQIGETNEFTVDSRPSDALSLAVRVNAPVYVEDEVMNRAGTLSPAEGSPMDQDELEEFDQAVQALSPDDF